MHRLGEWLIYGLVGLHIAAVAYYTAFRRVALIRPMVTGDRTDLDAPPAADDAGVRLRALALFLASAALVAFVVTR